MEIQNNYDNIRNIEKKFQEIGIIISAEINENGIKIRQITDPKEILELHLKKQRSKK